MEIADFKADFFWSYFEVDEEAGLGWTECELGGMKIRRNGNAQKTSDDVIGMESTNLRRWIKMHQLAPRV
jgi:hypothetical protein